MSNCISFAIFWNGKAVKFRFIKFDGFTPAESVLYINNFFDI